MVVNEDWSLMALPLHATRVLRTAVDSHEVDSGYTPSSTVWESTDVIALTVSRKR